MKIVFLLEEPSMKEVLNILLPQILPETIAFQLIPHHGKSDLRKSIPIKLKNWNEPDVCFVILHDQDLSDCKELKKELVDLCKVSGRPDTLVRIACQELESWYFGDLPAVEKAYGINLNKIKNKEKYRIPDNINSPKECLYDLLKKTSHSQIKGASHIADHMNIQNNSSESFNFFVSGVKKLAGIP